MECRQVGNRPTLKGIVMNGVKIGKVGEPENSKTDEAKKDPNEEKLRKSIIKRKNHEKHTILAETEEEEEQHVICIDVVGKEVPWHEVRKAREQCLRKSMNVKPLHNTRSLQSTRSGLIQTVAFEAVSPRTNCCMRVPKWRWARSARKDSSVGSVEGHNLDCNKSQGHILSHAHRRVT